MTQPLPVLNASPEAPSLPPKEAPPPAPVERVWPPVRWMKLAGRLIRASIDKRLSRPHPFATAVETAEGVRKRELLQEFGAAFVNAPRSEEGWKFEELDPAATAFVFSDQEGRRLELRLHRFSEKKAYTQTRHFKVSYRIQGSTRESDHVFLDRSVAALREREAVLDRQPDFPSALLARKASAVTLYLQHHRVELRPSLACNHRCDFCNSVDWNIDNVVRGLEDLRQTLKVWEHHPVTSAIISGGEPTLLRDLPAMIATLADQGLAVELQTNGMSLADPAYTQGLVQAGLKRALISLHSHDPQISDEQITHFQGGWMRTVSGIDQALAQGLEVHLSHVIHQANRGDVLAFLQLVRERWGRRVQIRLAFVAPSGEAAANFQACVPSLTEVVPGVRAGLAYAEQHRLRLYLVGYCGIPPCLLQPHESFSDVPYASKSSFPDDHLKLEACRTCVYTDRCPGLWADYYRAYGDPGLTPISKAKHLPKSTRERRYG